MTIRKEVIGGITTFLTMAYILAVNPDILSATGMDKGAVFTTTCISAVVGTIVMALYAKLPFALAPGMGLNAFFAFTVVLTMGYSWQFALTAVFIEGLIFILLTVTGLRSYIVNAIPLVLRRAISPGIGLFIAFVGLKSAGIVGSSDTTFVTMGNLHDPAVLLGIFGILITAALLVKNVTGSLLIGILVTTIVGIPLGVTHYNGILSTPPSIEPILWQFEWHNIFTVDMIIVVLTFLFIDMFDTIGTLIGVSNRAGMVDDDGNVKNLNKAFMADAIGTTVGAMLGTSTVTTYVESASGVNAGLRPTVPCHSWSGHSFGLSAGRCDDDVRHPQGGLLGLCDGHPLFRVHRADAADLQYLRRYPHGCHLLRADPHAVVHHEGSRCAQQH